MKSNASGRLQIGNKIEEGSWLIHGVILFEMLTIPVIFLSFFFSKIDEMSMSTSSVQYVCFLVTFVTHIVWKKYTVILNYFAVKSSMHSIKHVCRCCCFFHGHNFSQSGCHSCDAEKHHAIQRAHTVLAVNSSANQTFWWPKSAEMRLTCS